MTKTKLTNNFHNTEATIIVRKDGTISARTLRRAYKTLCGIEGCTCGNEIGERVYSQETSHRFCPIYDNFRITAYDVEVDE